MLIIKKTAILTLEDIAKQTELPSPTINDVSVEVVKGVREKNKEMTKYITPLIHKVYVDEPQNKMPVFVLEYLRSQMPSYQSAVERFIYTIQQIIQNHHLAGYPSVVPIIKSGDVDDKWAKTKHALLIYAAPKP